MSSGVHRPMRAKVHHETKCDSSTLALGPSLQPDVVAGCLPWRGPWSQGRTSREVSLRRLSLQSGLVLTQPICVAAMADFEAGVVYMHVCFKVEVILLSSRVISSSPESGARGVPPNSPSLTTTNSKPLLRV